MNFKEKLYKKAEDIGICLTQNQLDQFECYYHMLIEKNKVMNLTAITEEDEVIEKHFVDSLTCIRLFDFNNPDRQPQALLYEKKEHTKVSAKTKVIDIGTGAGFPGIPIKIAFPQVELVLLDSLKKRVTFLDYVIEELKLKDIYAIHGRAEDLARDSHYRASFDLCVSRAVADLSPLSEYCIPFLKKDGIFIAFKSRKGLEELDHIHHCLKVLKSDIIKVDQFQLGDSNFERVLIKIKKKEDTPPHYPRKVGIPVRKPL